MSDHESLRSGSPTSHSWAWQTSLAVYPVFIPSPLFHTNRTGFCLWRQCALVPTIHSPLSQLRRAGLWLGSGQWERRDIPWWGLSDKRVIQADAATVAFLLPWPGRWSPELWQPLCNHVRTAETRRKSLSTWCCVWAACAMQQPLTPGFLWEGKSISFVSAEATHS